MCVSRMAKQDGRYSSGENTFHALENNPSCVKKHTKWQNHAKLFCRFVGSFKCLYHVASKRSAQTVELHGVVKEKSKRR